MSVYLRVPTSDARIEFGTTTNASQLADTVAKAIKDGKVAQFSNAEDVLFVNFGALPWVEIVADPTPRSGQRSYQASVAQF